MDKSNGGVCDWKMSMGECLPHDREAYKMCDTLALQDYFCYFDSLYNECEDSLHTHNSLHKRSAFSTNRSAWVRCVNQCIPFSDPDLSRFTDHTTHSLHYNL
jgi:hypothetical protein